MNFKCLGQNGKWTLLFDINHFDSVLLKVLGLLCAQCVWICVCVFWRWLCDHSCDRVVVWVFFCLIFLDFLKRTYIISHGFWGWFVVFGWVCKDYCCFFSFLEWHFMVTSNSLFAYEENFLFQRGKILYQVSFWLPWKTLHLFSFPLFFKSRGLHVRIRQNTSQNISIVSIWYNSKAHVPNWQNQNC